MPCRNFLSTEFGAKFQREVALFLEVPEFPYNQPDSFSRFNCTPTRDRQTDTGPQLVPASGENETLIILVVLKSIVAYTVRNSSGAKNAPRLTAAVTRVTERANEM